jgi:glycine oxidase
VRSADAIIVGGGVVGCAVAWSLAREGLRVMLLERDAVAAHASGAAAGMLLPAGEVRGPGPLFDWGVRSLALFPEVTAELRERTGVDPELEASGALHVAVTEPEAEALRRRAAELPGLDLEWLDGDAARDAEPHLSERAAGAIWSPREAHVRSPLLAQGFAAAARLLGARVETGVEVTGLLRRGGRVVGVATHAGERHAGQVVLCTGAWAPACQAWLGADPGIPVEPVRGQIVSLEAPAPGLRTLLVAAKTYLVPKRDGSIVVGATEERVGFDCRVTADGVAGLLDAASSLAPALRTATFRSAWAGLRPTTPDGLPLIGPHPEAEGLLLAAGHHRNGVLLSPVTGRLVADLVLGKELPAGAAPLRPERFLRREAAHAVRP